MSSSYVRTTKCRISDSTNLIPVLDLGWQKLTGVFPRSRGEAITEGPLELVWCPESGLLQLAHSYDLDEMYGDNYGYRSGLNQSMVRHLTAKVHALEKAVDLKPGDVVLDIGMNDGTTLDAYAAPGIERIGIDPTAEKFKQYHPPNISVVADFFSARNFRRVTSKRAKIVTSIAMFYDLEAPIAFAKDVAEILAEDGVWHLEQSYMPTMLRMNSYDTICHEHIEYYSLGALARIMDAASLRILDVRMNGINGGSFAVTVTHKSSVLRANDAAIGWMLRQEDRMELNTPRPFRKFEERVFRHRADLTALIKNLVGSGARVLGYGASTKGNVVLQYCNFTESEIPAIAEVNPDKFGAFTPGTEIPIVSEEDARAMKPDYFLVLPWHFRENIVAREQAFFEQGGRMIFPFPEIEIV